MVSNKISTKTNFLVHHDTLGSDHYPIKLIINSDIVEDRNFPNLKYSIKAAIWSQFQEQCDQFDSLTSSDDPEMDYKHFIQILYEICDKTIR